MDHDEGDVDKMARPTYTALYLRGDRKMGAEGWRDGGLIHRTCT